MAVAVAQPQRAPVVDPLDQIIKGLSVASSVYNIKDAGDKSDLLKQQVELEKRKVDQADAALDNQGTITQKDLLAHGKDYKFTSAPAPGALKISVQGEDGDTSDMYATPNPKEKDPALAALDNQLKMAKLQQLSAKRIPGNEAMLFGQGDSASKALGALNDMIANAPSSGPMDGRMANAQSLFGQVGDAGKSAAQIHALRDTTALEVAAYLKGGSPTKEEVDMVRDNSLPQITDSPDVRAKKTENLRMLIDARRGSQQETLGQAGYDVSNFPTPPQHNLSTPGGGPDLTTVTYEQAKAEQIRRKGMAAALPRK